MVLYYGSLLSRVIYSDNSDDPKQILTKKIPFVRGTSRNGVRIGFFPVMPTIARTFTAYCALRGVNGFILF